MPALQHEHSCPSPDIPAKELLYRHSINSLLGLPALGASSSLAADSQHIMGPHHKISIPAQRVSQYEVFPNSPESGQTPRSLQPQYFPPANASCFASLSEIGSGFDKVLHRRSPESDQGISSLSTPSPPPNMDNSIVELMNYLAIIPQGNAYQSPPRYNGFRDLRERTDSSSTEDIRCYWYGTLPPKRVHPSIGFSPKVFLGGLPWDISESTLVQALKSFGQIRVEWPRREQAAVQPKGYAYVIFESERQVRALLEASTYDPAGNWYYRLTSKRMRSKEVQIIPWALDDSNYVKSSSVKLDPSRTVFVGALHGMLSAEGLAKIMNELFSGVVYAGIDTDKHKYPIGSGRVTFNNSHSYMRAVSAAFVEIKTEKFSKKVQVDPYLEDSMCSVCNVRQGPYFCRDTGCFRYFCRSCWHIQHPDESESHKPLMRHSKVCGNNGMNGYSSQSQTGMRPSSPSNSASSNGCRSSSSLVQHYKKFNGGIPNWNFKNIK